MRKPYLIGLTLVLAATLWASTQEDGDTVEAIKSSGPVHGGRPASDAGLPQRAQGAGTAQRRAGAQVGEPASAAEAHALQDRIAAWKQRAPLSLKAPAELKAWGPSLPPAPPTQIVKRREPPPTPMAPRFPHAWVGRFNDMAVVSGPQSTWVVGAGQVIEGQWRIDQIQERRMQLTYLPLQQAQTVAMKAP